MKIIASILIACWLFALPSQAQEVTQPSRVRCIAVGPNDSHVIVIGRNGLRWRGIPEELKNKLLELNQAKKRIDQVVLNQDGSYVVIYDSYGYFYRGISEKLAASIQQHNQEKVEIKHIATTSDGAYVLLSGKNGFESDGVSSELGAKLLKFNQDHEEIKKITLGPNGSYVVLRGNNGFAKTGISTELASLLWAVHEKKGVLNDVVLTDNGYILNSDNDQIVYESISDNLAKILPELVPSVSPDNTSAVANTNECEWREREVTITVLGSDELWLYCNVTAYTCNSEGKPSYYGNYVLIKNGGKEPFYYRSSPPNTYENPATKTVQRGTTSNAFYLPVGPGEARIIDVVDYRNQKEKYLPTHAVLAVKYCKPANKPTQDDQEALQAFKANQQQYIIPAASQDSPTITSAPSPSGTKDCGNYYFFAVVSAHYFDPDVIRSHIQNTCSNIYRSAQTFPTESTCDKGYCGNLFCLPQCPVNDMVGDDFTNQNLLKDVSVDKTFNGLDLTCSAGTGPYDRSVIHIFWGQDQSSLEAFRNNFLSADSYLHNLRPTWGGGDELYRGSINDSVFTFNEEVVCPLN